MIDKTVAFHGSIMGVRLLHVETDGCIVNIRTGLRDDKDRRVTSIEVLPDQYVGEEWHLDGYANSRVIEGLATDSQVTVALGDGAVHVGIVGVTDEGLDEDAEQAAARQAAVAWNALMRNGVFKVGEYQFTAAECAEWWA